MKSYREQFEEVWPVPDYATWCRSTGMYWYLRHDLESPLEFKEWNDRLDTFSRCQETTDVYVSLVDDLVKEIESCYGQLRMSIAGDLDRFYVSPVLDRAKKIIVSNGFEARNK